ncbi:hypothetical protein FXO38_26694 [Capsicum annuum]|nr:hypothetical protein FXO38_26694 [Capsicum annuum]
MKIGINYGTRQGRGELKKRSRYPCRAETSKASIPFSHCLSRCFSLLFFPTLHVKPPANNPLSLLCNCAFSLYPQLNIHIPIGTLMFPVSDGGDSRALAPQLLLEKCRETETERSEEREICCRKKISKRTGLMSRQRNEIGKAEMDFELKIDGPEE